MLGRVLAVAEDRFVDEDGGSERRRGHEEARVLHGVEGRPSAGGEQERATPHHAGGMGGQPVVVSPGSGRPMVGQVAAGEQSGPER